MYYSTSRLVIQRPEHYRERQVGHRTNGGWLQLRFGISLPGLVTPSQTSVLSTYFSGRGRINHLPSTTSVPNVVGRAAKNTFNYLVAVFRVR